MMETNCLNQCYMYADAEVLWLLMKAIKPDDLSSQRKLLLSTASLKGPSNLGITKTKAHINKVDDSTKMGC